MQSRLNCSNLGACPLNILRNYSAHHARMFNRVYTLKPRLPRGNSHLKLAEPVKAINRAFSQLSLIQYLLKALSIGDEKLLPSTLNTYPEVPGVPISHLGAPSDCHSHPCGVFS